MSMTPKKSSPELKPFDAAEYLVDETAIAEYLTASFEMGDEQVLLNAIGTVARARGMSQIARDGGLGRESLYKALAPGAKPRYDTLLKVIRALGVDVTFSAAGGPVHWVAEPDAVGAKGRRSEGKAGGTPGGRILGEARRR